MVTKYQFDKINIQLITQYFADNIRGHILLYLFIIAIVIRICLIFVLQTYSAPYHSSEHVNIANRILSGKGYSFTWYDLGSGGEGSFMPPVYVGIVLAAKIIFPKSPWLSLQIFQALLSAGIMVMIYFIGKEVFSKTIAIIASLLFVIYPPNLGYVLDIQSLTIETFLVTALVLVYLYWYKSVTWPRTVLLGIIMGFAVLSRSNLILLLPLMFVGWIIFGRLRDRTGHFFVMVSVFLLILGIWILRNYSVHKDFVLVSTNGGFNFFMGNNLQATGVTQYPVWTKHPQLARELAPLDEVARDKRLFQEGIKFVKTHPEKFFSLNLKKFIYFWWFSPDYVARGSQGGYPWYYSIVYIGSYGVMLPFSILGLVVSYKKYKSLFIIYSLFLIQTIVSMVFVAGPRYRGILEPLILVFSAYGLVWSFHLFFPTSVHVRKNY